MSENVNGSITDSLLSGLETVVSSKTVVGEPTKLGDTIILPLVDISFGMGAGKGTKGNGGGIAGKVSPSAVLVIKDGVTKLVNVKNQDAVTKVIDMVPDVVDKITALFNKKDDMPSDEEVIDTAFPEEK